MADEPASDAAEQPVSAQPVEESGDAKAPVLEYAPRGSPTAKPQTGLVTVATYANGWEAHLAAGKLEAEGIACFVADENIVTAGGIFYTGFTGGIKLQVMSVDLQRAMAVLPQTRGARPVVCPRCQSIETRQIPLSPGVKIFFLLLLGLPYLFINMRWICTVCGNVWKRSIHAEEDVRDDPEDEQDDEEEDDEEEDAPERR